MPSRSLPSRCCLLALLMIPLVGRAQVFSITEPQVTACAGTIHDSGGPGMDGYGPNETYATTICPDEAGLRASVEFSVFDLPGAGDALTIHDGPTTDDPVIGTFTEEELDDVTIQPTSANPSGCLTLVFTSGPEGDGLFAVQLDCVPHCHIPAVSFTTAQGDTARLCAGATLEVDGSASAAAEGHVLSHWIWSYGATADTTDGPLAELEFPQGGYFPLMLTVVDETGCTRSGDQAIPVFCAPEADITLLFGTTMVCTGISFELEAVADQAAIVGNTLCGEDPAPPSVPLPDDVGVAHTSSIELVVDDPEAVVTDPAQVGDICLDMEHSYMADLVIFVTCPNGQQVLLHQQGGNGTYLGSPNDDDGPDLVPGTCATYCFSADPQFGTWAECGMYGATPNVMPVGDGVGLIPGSYTPLQPLSNFIGCPMNGTWTLRIVDHWGSDNGFLCTWCVGGAFGPDSSLATFGPVLGAGDPDSSFWSGTSVVNDPLQPGSATATIGASGTELFTYTVSDSYGCAYDTTIAIEAVDGLVVSLEQSPDGVLCVSPPGLEYAWTFLGEPIVIDGDCWTPPEAGLITVQAVGLEPCSEPAQFLTTALPERALENDMTLFPVPNTGAFTVQAQGLLGTIAFIRVTDIAGRTVFAKQVIIAQRAVRTEVVLNAAPGVYVVELTDLTGTRAQRSVLGQ